MGYGKYVRNFRVLFPNMPIILTSVLTHSKPNKAIFKIKQNMTKLEFIEYMVHIYNIPREQIKKVNTVNYLGRWNKIINIKKNKVIKYKYKNYKKIILTFNKDYNIENNEWLQGMLK